MKILKTAVTVLSILAVAIFSIPTPSFAEIPKLISYQGKLTDTSGKPVSGVTYDITFRIYEQESGGSPLWSETQTITVQKGIFSTQIGATKDLNLAFDKPYFLGIQIGSDTEMFPRQRLASSAYAFRAEVASRIGNYDIIAYNDAALGTSSAKNKIVVLDEQGQLPMATTPKRGGVFAFSEFGGDGSDGDVVISSNTDTSGQAKQYNNLTINPGVTLTAKNCYIAIKGTLTVNGTISADGGGFSGGSWHWGNPYYGDKGYGFNDNSETNVMVSMALFRELCTGGDGGDGSGNSGGRAGGNPVPQYKKDRLKYTPYLICFSWGGGGGGGTRADASGGQGGGFLYIEAKDIIINSGGKISANGSTCNQTPAGGGGGGTVYLIYRNIGNNGIVEAVGGSNMGGSGQKGRDGTVILRKI